jgi:hypothetical protein
MNAISLRLPEVKLVFGCIAAALSMLSAAAQQPEVKTLEVKAVTGVSSQVVQVTDPASARASSGVRSALENQPVGHTIPLPAFLAGLRGESGVFVVNAMWPESDSRPQTSQVLLARAALPEVIENTRTAQEAPVHAIEMPQMLTASITAHRGMDASVHSVIVPAQTSSIGAQPLISRGAIRRVFNSPGTN